MFYFWGLFSAFFWVILLLKMAPKCTADVLFTVPKLKEALMCFMEKTRVLDELSSGMS